MSTAPFIHLNVNWRKCLLLNDIVATCILDADIFSTYVFLMCTNPAPFFCWLPCTPSISDLKNVNKYGIHKPLGFLFHLLYNIPLMMQISQICYFSTFVYVIMLCYDEHCYMAINYFWIELKLNWIEIEFFFLNWYPGKTTWKRPAGILS